MLPPWAPGTGALPPGIHTASWKEIVARFGTNSLRLMLLAGLRKACLALAAAGCRRLYLDGSFVTATEAPGDVDVAWEAGGVDIERLMGLAPALAGPGRSRAEQRQRYGGDYYPSALVELRSGLPFVEFFQLARWPHERKGIVCLSLVTDPAFASVHRPATAPDGEGGHQ